MTLLAAILVLQVNLLFAGNEILTSVPNVKESASVSIFNLTPAIPSVATFEEMPVELETALSLAPLTPAVADFEEIAVILPFDIRSLAPSTPAVADFD